MRLGTCKVGVVAGVGVLTTLAVACMWDTDTLKAEAEGKLDLVRVITGRFERWPNLYYQMRLERVKRELADPKTPDSKRLLLYDDASVALDRLKRSGDAIQMIERKGALLKRIDLRRESQKDAWYRYYANVGTFWAHRWLADGGDRTKLNEMRQARDLIAAAIKINPDAHFGRERYQLYAIEWTINPYHKSSYGDQPKPPPDSRLPTADTCDSLGQYIEWRERDLVRSDVRGNEPTPAEKGLAGLVMLGSAWESVDIFEALARVSNRARHTAISRLAARRLEELIAMGRKSVIAGYKPAASLTTSMNRNVEYIDKDYDGLRTEADAWAKARENFVIERLRQGRHPDTDPKFWDGYAETAPPELSDVPLSQKLNNWVEAGGAPYMMGLICCGAPVFLAYGVSRIRKRRRLKRSGLS